MLVPNILLQLLSSVGIFTSYNIGCCVLQPDVSPPRAVPGRVSPSLAGAQRGALRQGVWAGASGADAGREGQPAAHLMPFIL